MSTGASSQTRGGEFRSRFVVEEQYLPVEERRGLYRMSDVLIAAGLVAFQILLVGLLTHTGVERLDTPVERWFDALRPRDVTGFMIAPAVVFGPVGMPIVTIVWLLFAKHAWRPILLACGKATGVIVAFLLASRVQRGGLAIGAFTIAILPILPQVSSRLYLGYHDISDTSGSISLSAFILGVVIAIDTRRTVRIRGERVEGKRSQIQRDGS